MAKPILKRSNKMGNHRKEGSFQIRAYHRKAHKKTDARYLLKCGCCDQKVKIYYGDGDLEINGVFGSVEDWREILIPLLTKEKE